MEGRIPEKSPFETWRKGPDVKKPLDLVCSSNNPILMMCVNPTCIAISLTCDTHTCPTCPHKQHRKCPRIEMEGVVETINTHISTKLHILEYMDKNFFKPLWEMRNELAEEIRFAGLSEKSRKTAEDIFDRKNTTFLQGKEAAQFMCQIQEHASHIPSLHTVNSYLEQSNKLATTFRGAAIRTKRLLFDTFTPVQKDQPTHEILFGSKILAQNREHTQVLKDIISQTMQLRSVKRLFRASEHDFSTDAFHQYCDNKEDILVLVRTEYGKTIGGFTRYPWTSDDDYLWINNIEERDFIFSLNMKEKFVPHDNSCTMMTSCKGPIFGGSDLLISTLGQSTTWGVTKRTSTCHFPYIFNRAGENKLEQNGETCQMFIGGEDYIFEVEEYEVFQLFYK